VDDGRPRPEEGVLARNMRSLLEVSKALGAEARLDSLLAVIVNEATKVMEAERSSIFIHDEASRTLSLRVSEDLARGQIRIPVGVGIAGHVAATRETLNVPDAYADPRFNRQFDRDTGFRTRSILCAPVLNNSGSLIGVIQILNKVGRDAFTEEDESLLAAFASIAGIALDRARLVEAYLEKEKIESSLKLAHDIQMGMLPREFPSRPGLDLWATLRPAKTCGGDLFDLRLDGDRLWFVVGDVSGKGVPAALFMAVTKVLFGASVEVETSPGAVLARMNRALCRENEHALFVSAFVARLDLATGELAWANAGHNLPYRLGDGGAVTPIPAAPGLVLGLAEEFEFRSEGGRLAPGEGLFLYTDGVTEAIDPGNAPFAETRLEACLEAARDGSARETVEEVIRAVDDFAGGAPQFDDITALALRWRPRGRAEPLLP
jgi:serine phosphatase RsbU (regulator of sigma subunit)